MKYIKTFEEIDNSNLIPNYMYKYSDTPALFLGYDKDTPEFPLVCITFPHKKIFKWDFETTKMEGIQWIPTLRLEPLNIHVKDYLLKHNLAVQLINYLQNPGGLNKFGKEKAEELRNELVNDEDFQAEVNSIKFNI